MQDFKQRQFVTIRTFQFHIPSGAAEAMAEMLKRISEDLAHVVERENRKAVERSDIKEQFKQLNVIGPRFETMAADTSDEEARKTLYGERGALPATVDHYIKKHKKLLADKEQDRRNRLVLAMYMAGFSHQEIADQAELSASQVNRIIAKGKNCLPSGS